MLHTYGLFSTFKNDTHHFCCSFLSERKKQRQSFVFVGQKLPTKMIPTPISTSFLYHVWRFQYKNFYIQDDGNVSHICFHHPKGRCHRQAYFCLLKATAMTDSYFAVLFMELKLLSSFVPTLFDIELASLERVVIEASKDLNSFEPPL